MNDFQIKGGEDYGKLCCFRDDEGNEFYGHLSLFMKANSNNPNERDMYFRLEDGKAYRMAWKVDEEDVLTPDEEVIHEQNKTIERLQEQLNEANEALKDVCMHAETEQFECRCGWVEPCKDCNAHYAARDYLEKWGVK